MTATGSGGGGAPLVTGGVSGSGGLPGGDAGAPASGGGMIGSSGGAVGTGGRGGGGAPSAGGTSGAMCPAGALFCEGFETYAASATPGGIWAPDIKGNGSIKVETGQPYAGSKALHITGTMNTDRANIETHLAVAAPAVFVRFMMYTAGYPSSNGVHTRLMRLGTTTAATGDPYTSYSFSSYNGTAIEKVNSIYMRDTATHLNDSAVKNRWVCWEFEIDRSGGVGKVAPHIWLDGRELSLAAAGSTGHGMTSASWDPIDIQVFLLGLDGFQADTVKADFWLDEIVINGSRVGCPAK